MVVSCFPTLDPSAYQPHVLHDSRRNWPETNCYVDLWIEILSTLNCEPAAALGFTAAQDFEGDQFTFFKFPAEDLEALFGLRVQELAIFDRVETHALEQLRRGRLVLVEVDSFYLPDTRGTSYGKTHGKTTIAINRLDSAERRLQYFHNAGYFELSGTDFDGIFRPASDAPPELLFPYVEFVKIERDRAPIAIKDKAIALLTRHVNLRPRTNPIRAYQAAFPIHLAALIERPMEFFHLYAFNTLRQCGANFELLGNHLAWLQAQGERGIDTAAAACEQIAAAAKALQFQLARAVSRKQLNNLDGGLDKLAESYDIVMSTLRTRYC